MITKELLIASEMTAYTIVSLNALNHNKRNGRTLRVFSKSLANSPCCLGRVTEEEASWCLLYFTASLGTHLAHDIEQLKIFDTIRNALNKYGIVPRTVDSVYTEDIFKKDIRDSLLRFRRRGISIDAIAEKMNISKSLISEWRVGRKAPHAVHRQAVIETLRSLEENYNAPKARFEVDNEWL